MTLPLIIYLMFSNMFPKINHSYVTRSVSDELLLLPKPSSSSLFNYVRLNNGLLLWNSLPYNAKLAETLNILKNL